MDTYREKVIMSYLYIRTAQEDLMDRIVNVGMAGEYQDIGKTFSPDDYYDFDIVQFRDTDDVTLNTLLNLFDEMEAAKDLIKNVNAITDEEIAAVFPDWLDIINPYYSENGEDGFEEYDDLDDFENSEDAEDWDD